jgi:hypothetical protein
VKFTAKIKGGEYSVLYSATFCVFWFYDTIKRHNALQQSGQHWSIDFIVSNCKLQRYKQNYIGIEHRTLTFDLNQFSIKFSPASTHTQIHNPTPSRRRLLWLICRHYSLCTTHITPCIRSYKLLFLWTHMRSYYHTNPTTTPYDTQGNYPNMSGGVQYRERREDLQIQTEPISHFENRLLLKIEKRGKVVTEYRVFHDMLNIRYEYVGYKINSNGKKDSSQLCPAALTLKFFQCLLEVQCS